MKGLNKIMTSNIETIMNQVEFFYKSKDYSNAYPLYSKMWNELKINDPYIMFKYGNVLRNIKKSKDFIKIYNEYDFSNITSQQRNFVDKILSWCLYDVYIKPYKINDVCDVQYEDFILNAHRILEIQNLNNHKYYESAFVKTCLKVAKIIARKDQIPNYKEIIWWIKQLDVSKLSVEPYEFIDKEGKQREIASDKEIYYQYLSKCYEKMNDFDNCFKICEQALSDIGKFHYRNHIWIKERKLYCSCFLEKNFEDALKNYTEFAEKQQKYYMFHKLANMYYSRSKIKESVIYGCKALLLENDVAKIINLLEDLAYYWREYGNSENARKFFYACAYYRTKRRWKLSQELRYEIQQYNFSFIKEPYFNDLILTAKNFVNNNSISKIQNGKIVKLNKENKFGFIKTESGSNDNIYFNFKNVIDKKVLFKNSKVIFEEIVNKRNLKEAINIRGD